MQVYSMQELRIARKPCGDVHVINEWGLHLELLTFNIRTSRSAVFLTCSSSSDSLNFLMATIWPSLGVGRLAIGRTRTDSRRKDALELGDAFTASHAKLRRPSTRHDKSVYGRGLTLHRWSPTSRSSPSQAREQVQGRRPALQSETTQSGGAWWRGVGLRGRRMRAKARGEVDWAPSHTLPPASPLGGSPSCGWAEGGEG
eukprot:scaffold224066_cov34-Tisochrysis_lutea.AAC.4